MPGSRIPALLSKSWTRSLASEVITHPEASTGHTDGEAFPVVGPTSPLANKFTPTETTSSHDKGDKLSAARQAKPRPPRRLSKEGKMREKFYSVIAHSMSNLPCWF